MERTHVSSGTEWESKVGYSRAVRVGSKIHRRCEADATGFDPEAVDVSGTTPTDDDGAVRGTTPHEQTVAAFEIMTEALHEVDASLEDVVRTRMYVADIDAWEAVGEAHAEFFEGIRPATTMVEVSRLIDEDYCVEVEATAVVDKD